MSVEVRLASPGDAAAVVALFERSAVPCHCRFWHFEGTKNDWLARCAFAPEASARELDEAVGAGRRADGTGLVAVEGGEVRAWAKLMPHTASRKLLGQGPYRTYYHNDPVDGLCLGCMLVEPAHRREGLARELTLGIPKAARLLGARFVEAFPRVGHGPFADEELWMGLTAHLEEAGFERAGGEPPYPIYRLDIR